MSKKKKPKRIDLTAQQMEDLLKRIEEKKLEEGDWAIIKGMAETITFLSQALQEKNISIKRLLKMVFGAGTESKKNVLDKSKEEEQKDEPLKNPEDKSVDDQGSQPDDKKAKGHGRNGAKAYQGAKKVFIPHETLKSGDLCPECEKGKVYRTKEPGVVVRVVGGAPVQATVYELEKLRCNLCGKVFTAQEPKEAEGGKYDATAGAMISLLKYGAGFPFYRLEGLQQSLGIPLPASTQWKIVEEVFDLIYPVYEELFRQAAQGDIIHNDDTVMKVLALINGPKDDDEDQPSRCGIFTTGILSIKDNHKIALFFTGTKHAGENLADLLKKRHPGLPPPIQMCDALSRNVPQNFITLLANCLSHGRRKFVELITYFPQECRHVIETIAKVYHHDSIAKEKKMSDQQRLQFHQQHSAPLMEQLKIWLKAQMEDKKVEPNSSLGKAFQYLLNHWGPLTLFLRVAGAPLDNNIVERALKQVILHRKNALFFKTMHGAKVGDLFMSLIHTCRLAKVNPLDYLTALQKYKDQLSKNPQLWTPWNYQDTIASLS
jgi:transposase